MTDDKMSNIRSQAAMLGCLREPIGTLIKYSRAELQMEHHKETKALRSKICSLEARVERLAKRAAIRQGRVKTLMVERSMGAPFEWIFMKAQIAMLDLRIRRLEKSLDNAKSELIQRREEMSTETKRLEEEIQLHFAVGERLNDLTEKTSYSVKEE